MDTQIRILTVVIFDLLWVHVGVLHRSLIVQDALTSSSFKVATIQMQILYENLLLQPFAGCTFTAKMTESSVSRGSEWESSSNRIFNWLFKHLRLNWTERCALAVVHSGVKMQTESNTKKALTKWSINLLRCCLHHLWLSLFVCLSLSLIADQIENALTRVPWWLEEDWVQLPVWTSPKFPPFCLQLFSPFAVSPDIWLCRAPLFSETSNVFFFLPLSSLSGSMSLRANIL